MASFSDVLTKRSYGQITGEDLVKKTNKLRKIESDVIAKYIYGSNNAATYARFFTRDGLIEFEVSNLGVLMFRLETGAESPAHVIVSLFFIAMRCHNVSASVNAALAAAYSSQEASAALYWLDMSLHRLDEVLCLVGCTNSVSPGTTNMMTCVMNGNVYNTLKSVIYPFLVLKDMFINLDCGDRGAEVAHAYFVIIYAYNRRGNRPSVYIAVTGANCQSTVLNILRHRFAADRYAFADRFVAGRGEIHRCVGTLRKIGYCTFSDIHNGIITHKSTSLPVVRLENFFVSIGDKFSFV
uniref:Capsid triplex subunit 1 n=1 Tax=Hipposideros bat herpesvirus TaxID=3141919 RepID=A0AAU7E1E1_9VIRU